MTRHPQDIVRLPLITEKSTVLRESTGVYCFRVRLDANKIEIARAIEALFAKDKIKVAEVRTARMAGKAKRLGRFIGRRSPWKKAWVRLAPGSKEIELFEAK
jgi:large subunit ribosomal protein L23